MGHLLSRIYRRFFWQAYDNIGTLVAVNAIWFGLCAVPTVLCFRFAPLGQMPRLAATAAVGFLTCTVAGSGVFAQAARAARREEPSARRFFRDGRRFYARMMGATALFGILCALLFYSIRFYSAVRAGGGIPGYFLAGLQIWILAFASLMQVYLLPLIFVRDWGLRRAVKWSAILVVLRPGLTILLFLQVFGLCLVLAVTVIGAVLVLYGLATLFLSISLQEVLREMERRTAPEARPSSWKEIFAERDRRLEEEDEDQRSLKDILRPWE